MTGIRIVPPEELSKEMLAIAEEDAASFPDSGNLPGNLPSRLYKAGREGREAPGMSAIRTWEAPEPDPMQSIIAGLIWRDHLAGLFGDGGAGKSLLAAYCAFCVVTGNSFFGRTVRRSNVLYVDYELEQSEFLRRAYRITRGIGLKTIPEGIFYIQAAEPLTNEHTLGSLSAIVDEVKAGLVIIDSFAPASCASDQVAPSEVVPFMQRLRQLGTVLLLDHVPKPIPTAAAPMRAYGSTFKHNLVRSSLRLERSDEGGMRLTQMKNNFGPLADAITFAMVHEINAIRFESIKSDDERLAGLFDRARPIPERIVEELRQFGEDGATAARLAEILGCSGKTVSNHLSSLRTSRRVEPAASGHWRVPDAIGNLPGMERK